MFDSHPSVPNSRNLPSFAQNSNPLRSHDKHQSSDPSARDYGKKRGGERNLGCLSPDVILHLVFRWRQTKRLRMKLQYLTSRRQDGVCPLELSVHRSSTVCLSVDPSVGMAVTGSRRATCAVAEGGHHRVDAIVHVTTTSRRCGSGRRGMG